MANIKKMNFSGMTLDQATSFVAGIIILLTILLFAISSSFWLLFTVLLGLDLVQAPFTHFGVLQMILQKFGFKSGAA